MTERRDTRIGTAIAGLREQRGWSQRALAKVIGLDQPAVSRVPARMRTWALRALVSGRVSLEAAAGHPSLDPESLARELERAGIDEKLRPPTVDGSR